MSQNDEPLNEEQPGANPAQPSLTDPAQLSILQKAISKVLHPQKTADEIQTWMKHRYGMKTAAAAGVFGQAATWAASAGLTAALGMPIMLPVGTGVLTGLAAAELMRRLKSKRTLVEERRNSQQEEETQAQALERLKSLPSYNQQHLEQGGEVQALLQKSAAFKKWFGDWEQPAPRKNLLQSLLDFAASQFTARHKASGSSVVVDEHGQPKPVYHGTMAQFDAFSNDKTNANSLFGPGHYFTENPNIAQGYMAGNALREHREGEDRSSPRLIKAYLNIRNPFDADAYLKRMATAPGLAKLSYEFISDALQGNKAATEKLKKLGYDGITHTGGEITKGDKHKVWIAFEPNQIKSTDNEGTFDANDPRMHKARGGEVPEVPGIPRSADEVPIKAQAGEMMVRNGPAQLYRTQLDQMNRGEVPHFAGGGMVLASASRNLPVKSTGSANMVTITNPPRNVPAKPQPTAINFPEGPSRNPWIDSVLDADDFVKGMPAKSGDSPLSWAANPELQKKVYGEVTVHPSPAKKRSVFPDLSGIGGGMGPQGGMDLFGLLGGGGFGGGGSSPKKGGPGGGGMSKGQMVGMAASLFPETAPFAPLIGQAVDRAGDRGDDEHDAGDAKTELVKVLRELIDELKKQKSEKGGLDPVTGKFTPTLGSRNQISGPNYLAVLREEMHR